MILYGFNSFLIENRKPEKYFFMIKKDYHEKFRLRASTTTEKKKGKIKQTVWKRGEGLARAPLRVEP